MTNWKKKWIIVVIISLIFTAIILPEFWKNPNLPQKLHGVWENSDPNYTDRYFLLDTNALGFGTGDGKVDWYEIVDVDEKIEKNTISFTIEYQKPNSALLKKTLYYDPENGGVIRFKNQSGINWFRVKSQRDFS